MLRTRNAALPLAALFVLVLAAAPALALPADDPAATEAENGDDIFSLLWKGGFVMIPIALASVLALTITIERILSLRRKKIVPPEFMAGLEPIFKEGENDPGKGTEYCEKNPCILGNLIKSSIPKIPRGELPLQRALEDAGAREVDRMKRSLKPLSMIATIAPLLGLLGTVYGMIRAFQAATNAGIGKSDVLAQGIYEALVTTAAGLTLAIPVLIIYLVLNNRVDGIVDHLDENAEKFISLAVKQETA